MVNFYDLLIIGGLCGTVLSTCILFFKKSTNTYLSRLLGSTLFLLALYFLVYELFVTRLILQLPLIYSCAIPLYYLIPPISYMYVRGKLRNEERFLKQQLFHMLPALIAFADLLPFYLLPLQVKVSHVEMILGDIRLAHILPMGYLPPAVHFYLWIFQGALYTAVQSIVIWKAIYKTEAYYQVSVSVLRWLSTFTALMFAIYAGLFLFTLQVDAYIGISSWPMIMVTVAFLFMMVSLFFKPEILYGFNMSPVSVNPTSLPILDEINAEEGELRPLVHHLKTSPVADPYVDPGQLAGYIGNLETRMLETELFREKKLSIASLAAQLEISPRTLSYILNSHYQQRFTDFINKYRVDYILLRFATDSWKGLTLEGLAAEAGFSSRSTFFSAFKKITGVSPTEYLQKQRKKEVA